MATKETSLQLHKTLNKKNTQYKLFTVVSEVSSFVGNPVDKEKLQIRRHLSV